MCSGCHNCASAIYENSTSVPQKCRDLAKKNEKQGVVTPKEELVIPKDTIRVIKSFEDESGKMGGHMVRSNTQWTQRLPDGKGGSLVIPWEDLMLDIVHSPSSLVQVTQYYHVECFFKEVLPGAKSWGFTAGSELTGFDALKASDQAEIEAMIAEGNRIKADKAAGKGKGRGGEGGKEMER